MLPVGVERDIRVVQVVYGRAGVRHEPPAGLGEREHRVGGQHGEQLLRGIEGRRELEGHSVVVDVHEVRREGRVVEGVVPLPRGTALIVVLEHPAEPLHVRLAHARQPAALGHVPALELVGVVPRLVARLVVLDVVRHLLLDGRDLTRLLLLEATLDLTRSLLGRLGKHQRRHHDLHLDVLRLGPLVALHALLPPTLHHHTGTLVKTYIQAVQTLPE